SSFFFSSRRRHTRFSRDWSSDVCSSDLIRALHQLDQAGSRVFRAAEFAVALIIAEMLNLRKILFPAFPYFLLHAGINDARRDRRSEERRVGKESRARGCLYSQCRQKHEL